jgi:hypothetical protein
MQLSKKSSDLIARGADSNDASMADVPGEHPRLSRGGEEQLPTRRAVSRPVRRAPSDETLGGHPEEHTSWGGLAHWLLRLLLFVPLLLW